ncbi:MAG: hypothetical protein VZR09_05045 [Candidatus Gastranaerophilaceae bacterium]|nr:hypothetical protein [Candidatus Gastranaerophilaceae bacterium]
MSEKDERNLQIIESAKTEAKSETVAKSTHQTNPLMRKFLEFNNEKSNKFNVRDLFRK